MSELLKGNFDVKNKVVEKEKGSENLEERFEREILKKIGGSICFVSKQKVIWENDELGK